MVLALVAAVARVLLELAAQPVDLVAGVVAAVPAAAAATLWAAVLPMLVGEAVDGLLAQGGGEVAPLLRVAAAEPLRDADPAERGDGHLEVHQREATGLAVERHDVRAGPLGAEAGVDHDRVAG